MSVQTTGSNPSALNRADSVATQWQDLLLLVSRLAFGWLFVSSAFRKLMDIPAFVKTMPNRGLPDFMGYIAPPVEFIGGLCIVFGFATRYAAAVMLLFLIIASFSSHAYWTSPPAQMANQSSHFWKNVAIMAGSVLLFVTGAGRYALDRMMHRN